MRGLASLVLILAAAGVAGAQSLGAVAERTQKERKGTGGKVFTNDDLGEASQPSPSPSPGGGGAAPGKPAGAKPAPPAAAAPGAAPAPNPAPTMDPSQRWRRDVKAGRDAVARAESSVDAIQKRLDALLVDRDPVNVGDPNRLQSLEAEKVKAMAELEVAKEGLDKARQALANLEEEARRAGVPPGWLREP